MNPRYPVYIISKGRWDSRLTSKALEAMRVPYSIVVEPQEFDQYAAVIDPKKIVVTPFSNLGLGSIPARNFVWEHAIARGADRHWILDDNIEGFYRLNHNLKTPVGSGTIFRAAEDFVDRYENVAISGFHYFMFASRKCKLAPYTLNSRVYSCILIKNDLPYRWRGRYNEDTDLSLRALKDGWCTVLFVAFLAGKAATMTMKGGNTDELYQDDGRLKMAESLRDQHPDVTKITWKWGRWQHHVDYSGFRNNRLRLKPDVVVPTGTNNYGMKLIQLPPKAQPAASPASPVSSGPCLEPGHRTSVDEAADHQTTAVPGLAWGSGSSLPVPSDAAVDQHDGGPTKGQSTADEQECAAAVCGVPVTSLADVGDSGGVTSRERPTPIPCELCARQSGGIYDATCDGCVERELSLFPLDRDRAAINALRAAMDKEAA